MDKYQLNRFLNWFYVFIYVLFFSLFQKKAKPEKKELGMITYNVPTPAGEKKGDNQNGRLGVYVI